MPALTVERLADGISCWEKLPPHTGTTWRPSAEALIDSQVIYSVPGPRLVHQAAWAYDSGLDRGATIQIDGEEVRNQPGLVALQVVAVPHGQQPHHRETIGDRRIDEGEPDLWVVLHRFGIEPPGRVAAALRPHRWPPSLRVHADSNSDQEPS